MALPAGCVQPQRGTIVDVPYHSLDVSGSKPVKASIQGNSQSLGGDLWDIKDARPWRYIVIHHSAQEDGSAASIDVAHRARGWDGLGYHFVIDNGKGGPDGRLEIGERWRLQKWGAHTGNTPGNEYNKFGIGICVIGNFNDHMPTPAQLAALDKLVMTLAAKYNIDPRDVIGHRDAPGAHTECPGDQLENYIKRTLRQRLARQMAGK